MKSECVKNGTYVKDVDESTAVPFVMLKWIVVGSHARSVGLD
jgi:hypothetical protein